MPPRKRKPKRKRTILVDADLLVFAACIRAEKPTQWTPDLWTLHASLDEAIRLFEDALQEIVDGCKADVVILALSDGANPRFRNSIFESYKSNRGRKPIVYQALREYVEEVHETFIRPTLEADDILGILLTEPKAYKGTEKVCLSIDKDLLTVPGLHINFKKAKDSGNWKPMRITEAEGDYRHMHQTLTGDSTDGYPGCKGAGPVKASKILEGLKPIDMWPAVLEEFIKAGFDEEFALSQARVARILRSCDYDLPKRKILLWTPPAAVAAG